MARVQGVGLGAERGPADLFAKLFVADFGLHEAAGHDGHDHEGGLEPHGSPAPFPASGGSAAIARFHAIEVLAALADAGRFAPPGLDGRLPGPLPVTDGPTEAIIASTVTLTAVPTGGVGVAYGDTFKLHSLEGSRYVIYLDFDGHTTTGTAWNSYWNTSSFYSPAFTTDGSEAFNASELLAIQQVWQRVAEFFSPFNINVTTQDPGAAALSYSGASDNSFGIRVVITDEGNKPWGGIGYVSSFAWNSDTPVFVYANNLADNAKYIADCIAHEVGHSLGLNHDGRGGDEYYWGHTNWAPAMGAGYNAQVVQWSNGAYNGATNTQDDLATITGVGNMGVAYRADDYGNTFSTAASFNQTVSNGIATVSTYGVITGSGARNDIDMFAFSVAAGGSVNLTVSGWTRGTVSGTGQVVDIASPFSMLDVRLVLFDSSFQAVKGWNDTTRQDGVMSATNLSGGTYYLSIDGTGWGDPMAASPSGWTEYGSLGQYMIRGTYTMGAELPTPPPPPPPPPPLVLSFDKAAVTTTEAGGAATVTLRATGATEEITAQISGLDATEGRLSASSVKLNAANNWTASLTVTGVNDRDADGNIAYTLQASAAGATGASLQVTNLDNDIGAALGQVVSQSAAKGAKTTTQTATNVSVAATLKDDGINQTITETGAKPNFVAEARWHFTGLTGGTYKVQADAWSSREQFALQYSVDNAATWLSFAGAPASALTWNGDYLATGVGSSLWVRAVDVLRTNDSTKDTIQVDLLTITADPVWG